MSQFNQMYKRQRKSIINALTIFLIGWGITSYKAVFLGLSIGTAVGLYNYWMMVRKTDRFMEKVASGQSARSLGMISRMALAGLAVLVALNYPDKIHLVSVIIGIMTPYIVIMIDSLVQAFRK
ncbi:ATP synthase subunit I [Bacillus solimangrovi]|uniref:ATP synthase subunit n=1 Tax=Bacillus solimangrovi TaxID=1305675 RepID=A0A1E5LGV6_9BACI|nr:ATP synthase subunit I [Bacillus solimangrovi]OEH93310.1 ATP synthase subunit [Bacillus solimangrovi]